MAWEWVAPTVTGVVAVIGMGVTYRTAQATQVNARVMAHEDRRQERLAQAYLALLELVADMARWATEVRPALDTKPPREIKPLPQGDEQQRVWALLAAYGSDAVQSKFEEFRTAVNRVVRLVRDLDVIDLARSEGERAPIKPSEVWSDLESVARPAVVKVRGELERFVAGELGTGTAEEAMPLTKKSGPHPPVGPPFSPL